MSQRRIRRLFLALFVLLPVQYGTVLLCEYAYGIELWPALVLPSFARVYGDAEAITVEVPEMSATFAEGAQAPVELAALLSALPVSHRRSLVRRTFPLPPDGAAPTALPADTRHWLRDRLHVLFPGRSVLAFHVDWVRVAYPLGSDAEGQRQALGTVTADLAAL